MAEVAKNSTYYHLQMMKCYVGNLGKAAPILQCQFLNLLGGCQFGSEIFLLLRYRLNFNIYVCMRTKAVV